MNSFLGMRLNYNRKAGSLTMDVQLKVDDFFKEHPSLKGKGLDAPFSADADEPLTATQSYIKANFATIAGTFIYWTITCRPDLSTIVIQRIYMY